MASTEDNEDDIWDSWEDMAESGELERRMEEREKEHMKIRDEIDKKLFDPGVRVLVEADSSRTQYSPQVRILRRNPLDVVEDNKNSDDANIKKVHKTLAQREAEYASARAPGGKGASDMKANVNLTDINPSPSNLYARIKARILGETEETDPDMPGIKNATIEEKLPDNVIRQPRGPDGSQGFALRR